MTQSAAGIDNISIMTAVAAVPEPSTYALMLGGLALLFGFARRSHRHR